MRSGPRLSKSARESPTDGRIAKPAVEPQGGLVELVDVEFDLCGRSWRLHSPHTVRNADRRHSFPEDDHSQPESDERLSEEAIDVNDDAECGRARHSRPIPAGRPTLRSRGRTRDRGGPPGGSPYVQQDQASESAGNRARLQSRPLAGQGRGHPLSDPPVQRDPQVPVRQAHGEGVAQTSRGSTGARTPPRTRVGLSHPQRRSLATRVSARVAGCPSSTPVRGRAAARPH